MLPDLTSREFRFRWSWDLPADPESLWPLVSDTDAFNRDTGLPPVEDARAEGEELGEARRRLRLALAGVKLEWEELPFEWVRPHRFGVVRRYSRGPLREMRVLAELEPLPEGGTRLVYGVLARPSGLLGLLTIPLQIGVLSRRTFGKVFREYGEAAAGTEPASPATSGPVRRRHRGPRGDMAQRLVEAGVPEGVADDLAHHVFSADQNSLVRIRPYVLAELWNRPRPEILEACLHATRTGFLELRWDVLCPLCRGVKESDASLVGLRHRGVHCDTCLVDFSGDFTESVELTFRPTPAVREVKPMAYCVAGPQVTPHVVAQQLLGPGEHREVRPPLEHGRYRLRAHGSTQGVTVRVDESGSAEATARLTHEGWAAQELRLGPSPVLALENATDSERLVALERTAWSDATVTAAEVTRLAVFRDLFSDELLRVGDFANVGTLSILFTDLRGSTGLYRSTGDAPAFGRVMRHFDVLRKAVDECGGTVVKTIGDAVMAVFPDSEGAVRAALTAQEGVASLPFDPPLVLKAGIHRGPCIIVTLNERLDYFGTSVNVAARLEGLSEGGDVVVSDAVRREPRVDALLAEAGVTGEPSVREIRGLEEEEMTVWRLRVGRSEA